MKSSMFKTVITTKFTVVFSVLCLTIPAFGMKKNKNIIKKNDLNYSRKLDHPKREVFYGHVVPKNLKNGKIKLSLISIFEKVTAECNALERVKKTHKFRVKENKKNPDASIPAAYKMQLFVTITELNKIPSDLKNFATEQKI